MGRPDVAAQVFNVSVMRDTYLRRARVSVQTPLPTPAPHSCRRADGQGCDGRPECVHRERGFGQTASGRRPLRTCGAGGLVTTQPDVEV
jgi:hypothetical protein